VVELAVARFALGMRTRRQLGTVALVNVVTNPLLNVSLALAMALTRTSALSELPALVSLAALELTVIVVEWRVFAWALRMPAWRALTLSLAINAASLAAGLVVLGA
jgi:uncharacterized membrane protein